MGQIRKRVTGAIAPGINTAIRNANTRLVGQADQATEVKNARSKNSKPGVTEVKGARSTNG